MSRAVQGNLQTVETGDFTLNDVAINISADTDQDQVITYPGVDPTTDSVIGLNLLGDFSGVNGQFSLEPIITGKSEITIRVMAISALIINAGQLVRITVLRSENLTPSALAV